MTLREELIVMGQIAGAVGLKGWLKVKTYTAAPEDLLNYPLWYLRAKTGESSVFELENGKVTPGGLQVKLAGVDDRTRAEKLRGESVEIPRSAFLPHDQDEYYYVDLVGLAVKNRHDEALGTVTHVIETGANAVLEVSLGEETRLIPFVGAYIDAVDLESGTLTADWELDY